jgi:hypothetical protein
MLQLVAEHRLLQREALLFLLYMAEPMRSGNSISRLSYADDIGIIGFGGTV